MGFTKNGIALAIQERIEVGKAKALDLTEMIIGVLKESLERGESVLISGFGTFEVKTKKPRRGRDPQTGKEITIDERRIVTLKLSKALKDRLNAGENKS
jgi:integration host factor subunit alpha